MTCRAPSLIASIRQQIDNASGGQRAYEMPNSDFGVLESNDAGEILPVSDYDLLPYVSLPIVYTQPAHMAALAVLHGLEVPEAKSARILELGCASGGNIIPLAVRFPQAQFVGIDLSERQIADGKSRVRNLGLSNIDLRRADIASVNLLGEAYDFIICHGVLSWVPKSARDAIFRICSQSLAPNGVAAISYNVLPGWHLRSVVRDACLLSSAPDDPPRIRVAKARGMLEALARATSEAEPYGQNLRTEAQRLVKQPASYILGEFLAADNVAFHVSDILSAASEQGLVYLSEGDLASSLAEQLVPAASATIDSLVGSDPIRVQQYIDHFSGRTFRRSLFVHASGAGTAPMQPRTGRLPKLHIASPVTRAEGAGKTDAVEFMDHRGRTFIIKDETVASVLAQLGTVYPSTLAVADIIRDCCISAGARGEEVRERIFQALYRLVASGRAVITTEPLRVDRAEVEYPEIWPLARAEAASGQPWITSLRHVAVPLNPILRFLVPILDGRHDRRALVERLDNAMRRGEIALPRLSSAVHVAEDAEETLDKALSFFARQGVLSTSASSTSNR